LEALNEVTVCIPAYNEEKTIAKVIVGAMKTGGRVIVCDDGSSDSTGEIAFALGAHLITHKANLGKGEALASLLDAARITQPVAVVTLDADDQHDPQDIVSVVEPILRGEADVVVGMRAMDSKEVPRDRAFGNKVLDQLTSASAGVNLKDTQSGFRAYSLTAINRINFHQHGMAVESQTLIDAAKLGLRIREVPITVRYEGIPQKRSKIVHVSEVIDYLITRTILGSPLLYIGLPGLVALVAGILVGVDVLNILASTHLVATGTALLAGVLIIAGITMMTTSLILKLMTAMLRRAIGG
jgi:glycosyltransferase involved in cell wall biosynthesis